MKKITKIIMSLMLAAGLAGSSFAAGPAGKPQHKNGHNGKVVIEHKMPKQNVKVVKVVKEVSHKPKPHHRPAPKKQVVIVEKHYRDIQPRYYGNDNAAAACVAVVGIGLLAAAISGI